MPMAAATLHASLGYVCVAQAKSFGRAQKRGTA